MSYPSRRAALSSLLVLAASSLLPATTAAGPVEEPQQRIVVFGDSQAQGLAAGFLRFFRGDRDHRILDRSKISTGLARLTYDWPAQARAIAGTEHADIAIALFGANDRPVVRIGGRVDPGLLQRFVETYGARVTEIAQAFREAQVPLVWVGHPIVRDPVYAEDMALLNDIFADRVTAEGATFLTTWDAFRGPDGAYAPYGRAPDGQTTRLRADDGVHMTPAGYDVITNMVLPTLEEPKRAVVPPPLGARPPSHG